MGLAAHELLSVDEYVRFELSSPRKHEYVAGMIYAMAGVTRRHNRIAINIAARLDGAAAAAGCRVSLNDVRLQAANDIFYYPDVMVSCGPEPEDPYIEDAPCLLVEVVSKSTASTDRREKATFYRRIPGLQAYWIVEQEERRVGRYWRIEDGEWQYEEVVGDGVLPCPCPPLRLSLEEIYART